MESNFEKVLDSGRSAFVDLKGNNTAGFSTYLLSGASRNALSHHSTLKSSSLKLGKRNRSDTWKTKCFRRSLTRYYMNFMKSLPPKRLMFYQNGGWVDHESEVVAFVRNEFELKKSVVEVKLSGHHLVFDFVRMVQFNFRTAIELPMAWIDEVEGCFFPEFFSDDDDYYHDEEQNNEDSYVSAHRGEQEIKLEIEIQVNGISETKVVECSGETSPFVKRIKFGQTGAVKDGFDKVADVRLTKDAKRLKFGQAVAVEDGFDKVADVRLTKDVGENQLLNKKVDGEDFNLDAETVRGMFLKGMNMGDRVNVIDIGPNSGVMWKDRLELFLKQSELTKKIRGNANICYAWLPSTKGASSGIMAYGLGHFGLQQIKSIYGSGVHLASSADTSANYCDIDENGVRYMILCRVIMGNMEMVHAGSNQFHPSSESFDSGVDDLYNPRQYVVWSMNINTHIYPEYVVSFKIATDSEGSVIKNNGNRLMVKLEPIHDMGNDHQSNLTSDGSKERTTSLNSTTIKLPKSPWMPLPILLAAVAKHVPVNDMKAVTSDYDKFRKKEINRESFVKNLRLLVGDTLLKTTITELNKKIALKNGTMMVAQNGSCWLRWCYLGGGA